MRTVALIVAILLGIAAAIGVRSYLKSQERKFEQQHQMVRVVVARTDILPGEELSAGKVAYQKIPAQSLTPDLITEHELGRYFGKEVTTEIGRGMNIRASDFIAQQVEEPSTRLAEGRRAVSISVGATTGVAGLIRPGDRVDIYCTGSGDIGSTNQTWRVLSDVGVLAVDDRMSDTAGFEPYQRYKRGYSTLTLAVTPLEAQILIYLQESAKLTFALRSISEVGQRADIPAVNASNIRELAEQANMARQQQIEEIDEPQ
jgi:pilus assembly protein CpaB